ncbi:hypothetical protein TCAL_02053 [Tigriopus californicus]|uniref:Eukaryotic translation initiation factor 3 subunit H n=1 Tax=Tigriopus californicus TaxID=6832 RepID=A0A553NB84_TIGCA|nr:eukaryotic translation initiation factor 3 subunit H-like [Tigriopus californicus]TRY62693.1 hypothetical protein TCAL_02053 [Tigriopus californicus]|eukprot:TCALIF_02053-PA protein Name:"Similar to CPIJ005299 Eukaryotic translation initiation factor 3 subunit H (Culex quinquefasciatus)" AED:0.00 eAED:0.00 QI:161/1/1/1/1/1/2/98/340
MSTLPTPDFKAARVGVDNVQIDGLVVMQMIKHCHGPNLSNQDIVQGALLGLVSDTKLEITHSFPFPNSTDESVDDEGFQYALITGLRSVQVDHLQVGWYQSAHFGNFLSPQLLESHFAYQTSIEESICLIFDTGKTEKGFLSLKAYRLTPQAIELYKAGEFTPEAIRLQKVTYDTVFQEVPIAIKNSHLVNELLLELSEQVPAEANPQYLDLGSADVLEKQLKHLIDSVDDLNLESIKFNKYQNMSIKQFQDKTRYLQKRQQDNTARLARGEEPLPDEDINKVFKPIAPPSRLNSLIMSGHIASCSEHVSQFCSSSMAKWFTSESLQNAKTKSGGTGSSS